MKKTFGPTPVLLFTILLAILPVLADQPTESHSEPVGFIRHELPAKSANFVASPFIPFSAKIAEILDGQLVGADRPDDSDLVQKWLPTLQDYVTAFKSAGVATTSHNDDLARDGTWATDRLEWPPDKLTFTPGEALRIVNRQAVPQQLFLSGHLILADTWPVNISPSLSLFSHPFVFGRPLNDAELGTKDTASPDIADFIGTIVPASDHWRRIAQGDPTTGAWIDAATGRPSALVLAPGHAYWYGRVPKQGFVWPAKRPYPNPFKVAPRAPFVFAMEPGDDEMTLHIACSGDKGEVLEVFYQDLADDRPFDPARGWIVAAQNLATEGRNTIAWTDFGGQSPVVPDLIANSVSIPRMRVYIVSRQDHDFDDDGTSDARELYVLGTNPLVPDQPVAAQTEATNTTPEETATAAFDLDTDGSPWESQLTTTQKYYFVDAARSVDTGNGESWATAKQRISSGVALAKTYLATNPSHECFVLVKKGTYSNSLDRNLNFENRAVRLVGDDGLGGTSLGGDSPVTITGGSTVRALTINGAGAGTLVKNFIIQNFTSTSNGTVYVVNSTVTFENCEFDNNVITTSTRDGGAMYLSGGTVKLKGCTFTGNKTTRHGGAIYVTGTDLEIGKSDNGNGNGCLFQSNQLTAGTGGTGGAISVNGTAKLRVEDSVFKYNYSTDFGGAIYFNGTGSGLSRNKAPGTFNCVIDRCTFSENSTRRRGGAVYNNRTMLVADSCLDNNAANNNEGGAIYHGGSLLIVLQSTLSTNSASSDGGGLYTTTSAHADIYNSTFYGNSATRGGGIYRYGGSVNLYSTIVARNTASNNGPDIRGTIALAQYSLVRDTSSASFSSHSNCILGASTFNMHALADNGGPTKTHAIDQASTATGSAAIDTGSNPRDLDYDQRGYPFTRTYGNGTDIGAFEYRPTYTITYNANGATSGTAPANQAKIHGINLTLATNYGNLAKDNHTFSGWNTQADGNGTNYAAGGTYTANAAVTLYAKWIPDTYTVTFDLDGKGTRTGGGALVQQIAHGSAATAPTVTANAGWHFTGWDVAFDNITGPLTVTAQYEVATYTVTYHANGATSGTAPESQTKTHGVNLTLRTNTGNLAKTGYTLVGWNTQAGGTGTDYALGGTYTANAAATLYAKWIINTYEVTFDLDGKGTRTGGGALVQQIEHGQGATAPTVAANSGWVFTGWDVAFDNITGPLTVTAQYEVATYTVTYHANDADSGTVPAPQVKTHDIDLTPLATNSGSPPLAKDGHLFAGWNTAADGSGTDYPAGGTYTANAAATLYAQFDPNPGSVTITVAWPAEGETIR